MDISGLFLILASPPRLSRIEQCLCFTHAMIPRCAAEDWICITYKRRSGDRFFVWGTAKRVFILHQKEVYRHQDLFDFLE